MTEWSDTRLGDVMHIKHGFAFPGAGFGDEPNGPQLVTPGNFGVGGGFRTSKPKSFHGEYPAEYVLKPGDLIITMTDLSKNGDTLGLPAIVPEGGQFLHNQRIGRVEITDRERVSGPFLSFYLRSHRYRSHILGTASGSTVKHTSPGRIESFVATLPALSEQRAIAEVLGALDDKIAANTKLAATAENLASAVYSHGVTGLPMRTMSSALRPVLGGTPARARSDYWDGAKLWISARDITGAPSHTVVDTEEKITDLAVEGTKAKPLPVGSVVLTARGTVGAVARLAEPASFNQSCYGFAPGKLPSSMLYFAVLGATERAKAMAHGSVFDTITMSTFDHLDIPEPTPEQILQLESRLSPLLNSVTALIRENRTLAATRDALLPQLMSGKLRVRDAEKLAAEAGA